MLVPLAPVHAATVVELADSLESGDPLDFLPAGGSVEVDDVGVLDGSVLVFNSAGNLQVFGYDMIRYELKRDGLVPRRVSLRFDLTTSGIAGSTSQFTVLVDAPSVRNLVFRSNGAIETYNPGPGASGAVAHYVDGTRQHVEMLLDTVADRWTVSIDDALVYDDQVGGAAIGGIRFSIGAVSGSVPFHPTATAYLDNIAIRAEDFLALTPAPVPLPPALWAMAAALPWLLSRFRRF